SRHRAHRRTDDRLRNEARDVFRTVPADQSLQLIGTPQTTTCAIATAIRIRRRNLRHVVHHGQVLAPPLGMPAEASRAQRHPAEPLPATHHQILLGLALCQPVLTCELDRPLSYLGAA